MAISRRFAKVIIKVLRVSEHEKVTNHDVVAFVRAMGETVGDPARRHIHRGLTSSDIVDTALAMGMRDSLETLITATKELHKVIGRQANTYKLTPRWPDARCAHAEPTALLAPLGRLVR